MNRPAAKIGAGDPAKTPGEAGEEVELAAVAPGLSRELRKLLSLLAAGAAIFCLFYFTPLGGFAGDIHRMRAFLRSDDHLWDEASYAGLTTLFVALGVPRLVFYGLGGLAFGFWQGLLLAQTGAVLGSYLTFRAVRSGGRGWFRQRFGSHRFVGKAFHVRSSIKSVVLIRQLPLSSVMITGGLALSQISTRDFMIGSFVGYLPQGVIATLIGSGMVDENALDGFGQLAAAGIVLASGAALLWRWRRSADTGSKG